MQIAVREIQSIVIVRSEKGNHLMSTSTKRILPFRAASLILSVVVIALVIGLIGLGLVATRAAEPEKPEWFELPFTDARTGDQLTLAGFEGKTVVVEMFATWCTNCRRQLNEVAKFYPDIDEENVVYLALGVDPYDDAAKIARYADNSGYEWLFGMSSRELTTALVAHFGRSLTAVSSIPSFIIRPDGTFTELHLGFENVDALKAKIADAQAASATAEPTADATADATLEATADAGKK